MKIVVGIIIIILVVFILPVIINQIKMKKVEKETINMARALDKKGETRFKYTSESYEGILRDYKRRGGADYNIYIFFAHVVLKHLSEPYQCVTPRNQDFYMQRCMQIIRDEVIGRTCEMYMDEESKVFKDFKRNMGDNYKRYYNINNIKNTPEMIQDKHFMNYTFTHAFLEIVNELYGENLGVMMGPLLLK